MKNSSSTTCLFVFLLAVAFGSLAGCGDGGNTVIQPSGNEPTAEETAEYQQEVEEMMSERD